MTKRKRCSAEFKAKVTLKAVREELSAAELANKCNIRPTNTAIESMASAFDDASLAEPQIPERNSEMLYAKIGQLVTERDASQRFRSPTGVTVAGSTTV